ncbi:MAG: universal stress protein [Acidobacteria bacterium]|nr:universal stress protein [Acidobacteriota bacterium]
MNEIRRVLVAADSSACAERAFAVSLALARRSAAELLAVHVIAPVPVASGPRREPEGEPTFAETRAPRLAAAASAAGVEAEVVVEEGDVADEILRRAEEWPADLLVVGTRSGRGPEEWALGSVAAAVLRGARRPVVVVPEPQGPAAEPALERLLCPLDFSEPSFHALEWGRALARRFEARLALLHVLEWFPEEGGAPSAPEYRIDFAEEARQRIRSALPATAWEGVDRELLVTAGRPHREILRVARACRTDLLVLGIHGRRGIDRVLPGSTLCHVVREAPCPILAVRPR